MGTNKDYTFTFTGAVLQFGRLICDKWTASTVAPTEAKARSNLAYRYKKTHNLLVPHAAIELQGRLDRV